MWAIAVFLRKCYRDHLEPDAAHTESSVETGIAVIGQVFSLFVITTPILPGAIIFTVLLVQLGRWWAVLSPAMSKGRSATQARKKRERLLSQTPDEVYPELVAWRPGDILENDSGLRYQFLRVSRDHRIELMQYNFTSSEAGDLASPYVLDEDEFPSFKVNFLLGPVMSEWRNVSLLAREPMRDYDATYWKELRLKQAAYDEVRKDSG